MVATVPTLFGFTRPLSKPIGWTLKGTRHGRSGTFSTSGRGVSGLPRFKKRTTYMSVDVPQASRFHVRRLNRRWGEVKIPFVGRVRFRWTCPMPGVSLDCSGRITGARLTKNSLGWHICFRVEQPAVKFFPITGPPIGVDRGVIHSLALSDGRNLDMPRLLTRGEEHRLRQLERRASRRRMARTAGKPMSGRGRKSYPGGRLAARSAGPTSPRLATQGHYDD